MCGSISPSRLMYWYPKSLIPFSAIASATDMISLEVQTSLPQLGRGRGGEGCVGYTTLRRGVWWLHPLRRGCGGCTTLRRGCGGCTTLRRGVWWLHYPQERGVVAAPPSGERGVSAPPSGERGVSAPPSGEGCGGCTALRRGVWWLHRPQERGVVAAPPSGERGVSAPPSVVKRCGSITV